MGLLTRFMLRYRMLLAERKIDKINRLYDEITDTLENLWKDISKIYETLCREGMISENTKRIVLATLKREMNYVIKNPNEDIDYIG